MDEFDSEEKRKDVYEKDFLIVEYQALREEILSRTGRQTQLTTLAIALLGGILAIVPFKLFSDFQSIDLNNPIIITELLIVSGLFTSILWVFMEQEMRVINAAYYIHNGIRVRAALLQNIFQRNTAKHPWDKELGILNWDKYLIQTSQPEDPLSWLIFIIRVSSRYVVMAAPSFLSLILAVIIYFYKFSSYVKNPINNVNLTLFILDLAYLISAICFAFYMKILQSNVLKESENVKVGLLETFMAENSIFLINHEGIPTTSEERKIGRGLRKALQQEKKNQNILIPIRKRK